MMVWNDTLDGRFVCRVVRNGNTGGILTVHDGDRILLKTPVPLAYGARFGADGGDVQDWKERCVEAVDAVLKEERQ